mmetsp:Transcript_2777/g.8377  ORF Transcript_2777/g.8377 Transcript_2777/m.8377 type:complete len:257 (+) Transcript_2777:739-1509(+)
MSTTTLAVLTTWQSGRGGWLAASGAGSRTGRLPSRTRRCSPRTCTAPWRSPAASSWTRCARWPTWTARTSDGTRTRRTRGRRTSARPPRPPTCRARRCRTCRQPSSDWPRGTCACPPLPPACRSRRARSSPTSAAACDTRWLLPPRATPTLELAFATDVAPPATASAADWAALTRCSRALRTPSRSGSSPARSGPPPPSPVTRRSPTWAQRRPRATLTATAPQRSPSACPAWAVLRPPSAAPYALRPVVTPPPLPP